MNFFLLLITLDGISDKDSLRTRVINSKVSLRRNYVHLHYKNIASANGIKLIEPQYNIAFQSKVCNPRDTYIYNRQKMYLLSFDLAIL